MQNFERFRYRCESVLRSITDRVAKKARVSEVMKTIIASKEVKNKLE